jgi:glucosamine-6-phosphate deaminase
MNTLFVKDYDEMSQKGFEIFREVIETKENPIVSINTGGTTRGFYKLLVEAVNDGLDISNTTIFVLDEYIGPKNEVYTVYTYIHENFLDLVDTQPKEVHFIDGSIDDPDAEIERYKRLLDEHPRDFQLLGLGTNGHIGANEPGTPFDAEMFLAQHTDSTIESTMKEYDISREKTPTAMITLGFKEILEAEKIVLMISGEHKAEATKTLIEGEVTENNPASILQQYENATVIIDEEAASMLEKTQ